jgi:uncharacterized membrane protein
MQKRTETLFDAVIAIAMTMIALEINIPEKSVFDVNALGMLFSETTIYFISFIVLSSVWGVHMLIYSTYTSLGTPIDIVINVILMFIITLFPVLTKIIGAMEGGYLLNLTYLCCYGVMEILSIVLLLYASRKNTLQRMDDFRSVSKIIEFCKDKMEEPVYEEMSKKIQLVEKYMDDPTTFIQLYQEFIATLSKHIQSQLSEQKHKQKIQYATIIVFYIIAFITVLLSVLTMMVNPYWCYVIFIGALVVFMAFKILLKKQERNLS